ncbi:AAA family ATPase [Halocynthiibacter sp. C4]|uniref:AAA family ATPase n=1 Tax=Halocynthiibacter sp. C4 TaxID=2992758 RepID=UPI00237B8972|nr:AAA family ATPase [Halocynthiibacter sp. C4]MDE0591305.1 AAA family ATPase [Halocynthiibacter sp. C4]
MSSAKQIIAMLRSRADGDDEMFYSVALQAAAAEARRGRKTIAEDIRAAVQDARKYAERGQVVPIRIDEPRGELEGLLELRNARFDLDAVSLAKPALAQIGDLIRQQHKRTYLHEHGKAPSKSLLFVGPPGSGKTMTAEAVAGSLRLPLFVIRFDSLITRFMGETASKMRLIFDEIHAYRGVYLFDEFDAVGANRGATNDVAEMRRVLNSFLQFMEETNSTDSVVIGATNFPELLDRALLRRFDLVLEFLPPTSEEIRSIIKANLRPLKFPNIKWDQVYAAADGLSQAEIARATEDAVKAAILDERDHLKTADIVQRLSSRLEMGKLLFKTE